MNQRIGLIRGLAGSANFFPSGENIDKIKRMSPRYYIVTTVLVLVLTLAISVWKRKRTTREIFRVFCQVALGLAVVVGIVAGIARLMEVLGIAQSGFIF